MIIAIDGQGDHFYLQGGMSDAEFEVMRGAALFSSRDSRRPRSGAPYSSVQYQEPEVSPARRAARARVEDDRTIPVQ